MEVKYDVSKGNLWKDGSEARLNSGGLSEANVQALMAGKTIEVSGNLKSEFNLDAVSIQGSKVVKKAEEPKAKPKEASPKDTSVLSADKEKPKNK